MKKEIKPFAIIICGTCILPEILTQDLFRTAENLPAVISFTVEIDGRLPSGMMQKEAIEQVDSNGNTAPLYYMINCARLTHFLQTLQAGANEQWIGRVAGIRANASQKSHAELDEATELDSGDPMELGLENQKIKGLFPNVKLIGGCCGTDDRHVREIVKQLKIKNDFI